MNSSDKNGKRWLTQDFVEKFRIAFGREMTADERKFFGLDEENRAAEENDATAEH
jgi:hypothetical protein